MYAIFDLFRYNILHTIYVPYMKQQQNKTKSLQQIKPRYKFIYVLWEETINECVHTSSCKSTNFFSICSCSYIHLHIQLKRAFIATCLLNLLIMKIPFSLVNSIFHQRSASDCFLFYSLYPTAIIIPLKTAFISN